jgi:hypothetical protein
MNGLATVNGASDDELSFCVAAFGGGAAPPALITPMSHAEAHSVSQYRATKRFRCISRPAAAETKSRPGSGRTVIVVAVGTILKIRIRPAHGLATSKIVVTGRTES